MAPQINPEDVARIMREVAAEKIIPRFKQLLASDIDTKSGPGDLVTIADKEAELAMTERLMKLVPGSIVVGEEAVSEGRADTAVIGKPGIVWVVDPVDGTYNFVHGKDEFGMLLACVIDGEVRHGWLYDIPGNRMLHAEKGKGAFVNGQPIRTAAPKPDLSTMTGHASVNYFNPKSLRPQVMAFRDKVASLDTLRCACHEYFGLATGKVDFGLFSPRLRPWDHLAGILAVREAGGHVAQWDGSAHDPANEMTGILVASSRETWQKINDAVLAKMVQDLKKTP